MCFNDGWLVGWLQALTTGVLLIQLADVAEAWILQSLAVTKPGPARASLMRSLSGLAFSKLASKAWFEMCLAPSTFSQTRLELKDL